MRGAQVSPSGASKHDNTEGADGEIDLVTHAQYRHLALRAVPLDVLDVALDMGKQDPVPSIATQASEKTVVIVSDISGFTKLSERHINDKDKMQQVINAGTLCPLQEILIKHGLELSNIAGDALIMTIAINEKMTEANAMRCLVAFAQEVNEFCRTELFIEENMAIKHAAAMSETFVDIYNTPHAAGFRFYGPALSVAGDLLGECEYYDLLVDGSLLPALQEINHETEFKYTMDNGVKVNKVNVPVPNNKQLSVTKGTSKRESKAQKKLSQQAPSLKPGETSARSSSMAGEWLKKGNHPEPKIPMDDWNAEQARLIQKLIPTLVLSNGLACKDAIINSSVICFTNIMTPKNSKMTTQLLFQIFEGLSRAAKNSGGAVLQFLEDDKGIVFINTYGVDKKQSQDSPCDDALLYALEVESVGARLGVPLATGIALGNTYQGPLGSPAFGRMLFTVMGFEVNLSARFMGQAIKLVMTNNGTQVTLMAPPIAEGKRDPGIECNSKGLFKFKGCAELIEAFGVSEAQDDEVSDNEKYNVAPPVGDSLQKVPAVRKALDDNQSVIIEGPSGCGKTLVASYVGSLYFHADSIHMVTAKTAESRGNEQLYPWKILMKGFFNTLGIAINVSNARKVLSDMVDDEFKETIGIMKPLLPWLQLEEGQSVKQIAKEAQARLLLATTTNIIQNACASGLVIIFDDAQWYDPESWRWVCVVVGAKLPGLRAIVTARPDRLENFAHTLDAIDKVNLSNLQTPTDCLDTLCRTLQKKLRIKQPISHDVEGNDDHKKLAQQLWDATVGNAVLVVQNTLNLLERGFIRCDQKTFTLQVAVDKADEFPISGLTELMQSRFTKSLSNESQDVFKYACLMGRLFDHGVLKCMPSGGPKWNRAVKEAMKADLVAHNLDTDAYEFEHISVVDAIFTMLTKDGRQQRFKDLFDVVTTVMIDGDKECDVSTYEQLDLFSNGMGESIEGASNARQRVLWRYGRYSAMNEQHRNVVRLFSELESSEMVIVDPFAVTSWFTPFSMGDGDMHEMYSYLAIGLLMTSELEKGLNMTRKACAIVGWEFHGLDLLKVSMGKLMRLAYSMLTSRNVNGAKRYRFWKLKDSGDFERSQISHLALMTRVGLSLQLAPGTRAELALYAVVLGMIIWARSSDVIPLVCCSIAGKFGCALAVLSPMNGHPTSLHKLHKRHWDEYVHTLLDNISELNQNESGAIADTLSWVALHKTSRPNKFVVDEMMEGISMALDFMRKTENFANATGLFGARIMLALRGDVTPQRADQDEGRLKATVENEDWGGFCFVAASCFMWRHLLNSDADNTKSQADYDQMIEVLNSPEAAHGPAELMCLLVKVGSLLYWKVCFLGKVEADDVRTAIDSMLVVTKSSKPLMTPEVVLIWHSLEVLWHAQRYIKVHGLAKEPEYVRLTKDLKSIIGKVISKLTGLMLKDNCPVIFPLFVAYAKGRASGNIAKLKQARDRALSEGILWCYINASLELAWLCNSKDTVSEMTDNCAPTAMANLAKTRTHVTEELLKVKNAPK